MHEGREKTDQNKHIDIMWRKAKKLLDDTFNMDSSARFKFTLKALRSFVLDAYPPACQPLLSRGPISRLHIWTRENAKQATECYLVNHRTYRGNANALPLLGMAASHMYRFVSDDSGVPFLRRDIMTERIETERKGVTTRECVSIVYVVQSGMGCSIIYFCNGAFGSW